MAIRAVKAIIRSGDKFLILKKSELVDIYPGQWDLPGGRLEPDETWDEGLAREVWEETALEVLFVCEVREWESQKWDTVGKTVLCEYQGGEVTLSWEHTEYHWLTFAEVDQGDYPEWIRDDIASARTKLGKNAC